MASGARIVWHVRNADRFGGPERLIQDQMRLASPAYAMSAVSFGADGSEHPFLAPLAEAGLATRLIPQRGSYDLRLFRRFRRLVREAAPAILVGHDYKANLLVRWAGRRRAVRRVALVHGYTGEDRKVRMFEAVDRRVVRRMDAVIVVSAALRDRLQTAGVDAKRIHLVPNAIDAEAVHAAAAAGREAVRAEWGAADDQRVVIALGRLSPEKGHDVLLDAWAKAGLGARDDLRLVLIGDGAAREALEAQAAGLGLDVHFAGWRTDPHACLGAADRFVLPSRTEGLPVALLESMAAGVPVVATDVGGVAHALRDGAGWVVPPEDAGALAGALTEAIDQPAGRAAIASERVRTEFAATAQAEAIEAVYDRLLINAAK